MLFFQKGLENLGGGDGVEAAFVLFACEVGWQKKLFGKDGHRSWHWHYPADQTTFVLGKKKPVNPVYRWFLDNGDTPFVLLISGYTSAAWGWLMVKLRLRERRTSADEVWWLLWRLSKLRERCRRLSRSS